MLDQAFIESDTAGFEQFAEHAQSVQWDDVLAATGLTREEIEQLHQRVLRSKSVIVCWAMGLTQQKHGVPTIREVVNFLLLRGNLGRPGAGVCPVRGHSNVQGDRTMGIWERMPDTFMSALGNEFGFTPPTRHGYDSVAVAELGFADRDLVDLVSVWSDGTERRAPGFRIVSYPAARGSAASYYPETNVLVPLDSVAAISNTPTSKGVIIRLEAAADEGSTRRPSASVPAHS